MTGNDRWLLPEGVEEVLPEKAAALESLRGRLLGIMQRRGFRPVNPPLMEFLDALLTGSGEDLDSQTYKVSDHMSQRTLGIRADLTPQIARIDAHYLRDHDVNRLCYVGPVLRTRPKHPGGARELLQIGAEMFGEADTRADCELIETMLEMLSESGVSEITVGLGHVGIYRELITLSDLGQRTAAVVFDALARRSIPDMDALVAGNTDADLSAFRVLLDLQGNVDMLGEAANALPNTEEITSALKQLGVVTDFISALENGVDVHIDLADLRGYHYHTGLTYQSFVPRQGRALAEGGRYDSIGEAFGRARPATGFSANLKALVNYFEFPGHGTVIIAPPAGEGLQDAISSLRDQGSTVISMMPGETVGNYAEVSSLQLTLVDGTWITAALDD